MAFLLAVMVFAPMASAAPATASTPCPSPTLYQVLAEVGQIPAGARLVLSISWEFNHEEDFGNVGYWALDSGIQSVNVWEAQDGSFYGLVFDSAVWQTYKGALSEGAGVVQPKDGSGPWFSANYFHIDATFTPGSMPTHAFVGSVNGGGTKADILLGTYTNGQVGDPNGYPDLSAPYFDGYTGPTYQDLHDDFAGEYLDPPTAQEICFSEEPLSNYFAIVGDIVT